MTVAMLCRTDRPKTAHRVVPGKPSWETRSRMTAENPRRSVRGSRVPRTDVRVGRIAFLDLVRGTTSGPERVFRMPAYPLLVGGILKGLSAHGLQMSMAQYHGTGPLPSRLSREQVDGVLILGSLHPMPSALRRALLDIPSVWVMRQNSDINNEIDHVFYDNQAVGTLAARYLLDRRHHHVAFILPDTNHEAFIKRCETFTHAIRWGGGRVSLFELTPEETARTPETGMMRAVSALATMRNRPTALFVPSDNDLLLAYRAIQRCGLRPMVDIDLVGCNYDAVYLNKMIPRPATIDIKLELVGCRAVDQLVRRIGDPGNAIRTQILIEPTLIPPIA